MVAARVPAGALPVGPGVTTDLPNTAIMVAIRGAADELRGTFVLESAVSANTQFSTEVAELGRGETGEVIVFDLGGSVIAATNPSLIAQDRKSTRLNSSH